MDTADDVLRGLLAAVYRYLDAPGCNAPSRQTKMAQLRHAADAAAEACPSAPMPPGDDE